MGENEKDRLTLRVEPEVREEIERHLERGGSRSMNQFLNAAVRHYLDYLDMKRVGSLLPREIMAAIEGRLGEFEHNMSRALFKLSTEVDMTNALVADLRQLSQDELDDLRASSVKNVRALNGMTSLDKYMRDREYEQKSSARNELVKEARHALMELARELKNKIADAPEIEAKMQTLAQTMSTVTGKHQYGYLKKPVKRQVDAIVDALEDFPSVHECYERWLELQNQVDSYYKDEKRTCLKLSEQKEFRAIKNAVIAAADQISENVLTFEDKELDARDEPDESPQASYGYCRLRDAILDRAVPHEERRACFDEMAQLAEDGDRYAQYFLGKLYRDGGLLIPDNEKAAHWFRRSAASGYEWAEYALGKLLESEKRMKEAAIQYEYAALQKNRYAEYRLAKLYLTGTGVPKDVGRAVELLEASAKRGNRYAQYTLGKVYLQGFEVGQNKELAEYWLSQAAEQGHAYAQFFLDHMSEQRKPAFMLAVTRLLHCLGGIFESSRPLDATSRPIEFDRKRFAELQEKRIAMGHKPDDHEDQPYNGMSMATPW